jgi:hypothetical protein
MAQQNSASPYAGFSPLVATEGTAAAGAEQGDLAPDSSGVDLASMFISTPAAAPGSTSPIAGVVAAGNAPAIAATATKQQQQLTPSAHDSVLMGSPAPTEAFAFSELTAAATADPTASSPAALPADEQRSSCSSDVPQPSVLLLPHAGTPGWSVDTELPPAGSPSLETLPGSTPAAAVTPASVHGGLRSATKTPGGGTAAKRTPAARSTPGLSPMADSSPMPPAGPPDFSDMESPLPPAMSPMMQVRVTETCLTVEVLLL